MMFEGERVIAATLFERGGKLVPFCLVTMSGDSHTDYDVDYSKVDDCAYFHQSGCGRIEERGVYVEGVGGIDGVKPAIYAAFDVGVYDNGGPLTPTTNEWPDCDLADLIEGEAVYCVECESFVRDEFQPCDHIRECAECSELTGAGLVDDDQCSCEVK